MNNIFTHVKTVIRNEYIILSIILLFGLAVRLYKINNPVADWHSWRQADTASVSRNFVKSGINLLYPTYDDISVFKAASSILKDFGWLSFQYIMLCMQFYLKPLELFH